MLLNEFDIARHVEESDRASRALAAFRNRFKKAPLRVQYYLADEPDIEFFVNHPKVDLKIGDAFVTKLYGEVYAAYFAVPTKPDKAVEYVMGRTFESLFRHEFQHCVDMLSGKNYSYTGGLAQDEYVNSDAEYSAWFKQLSEPLLAILRAAKNGESIEGFPKVDPDFARYIRSGQHFTRMDRIVPYSDFNSSTKKKYLRNLAVLHKAVVALGHSETFEPNFVLRMLMWVHNKTGLSLS